MSTRPSEARLTSSTSAMDSSHGSWVRVVLVGSDEHHGARVAGDVLRQVVGALERLGNPQAEQADELVQGTGRSGPDEQHPRLRVRLVISPPAK